MSEKTLAGENLEKSDAAAVEAAAKFWAENPEFEAAADREAPIDGPSAALLNEYADQRNSLEQSGDMDPTAPDGIPSQATSQAPDIAAAPATTAPPAKAEERKAPGLDPVLRAFAEEAGWSADKIDRFYEADPELATETFNQLADTFANLSRQFLLPTSAPEPPSAQVTPPAQVSAPTAPVSLPPSLSDEAIQRLAEIEGETAANMVKALRDHFVSHTAELESRLQKFEQLHQAAEMRAIAQEANTALGELRKQFPSLYGTSDDAKAITMEQYQRTVELASLADQIRAGATAQGRTLSVKDAIKRAHYIVSRDAVRAEARAELKEQVKKRAQSVSARPTHRHSPSAPGQARNEATAIAAAAEKMAEIGLVD